jgi:hypothetical protein
MLVRSPRRSRSNKLGAIEKDIQAADLNGYAGDTTAYAGAEGEGFASSLATLEVLFA